MLPAISYDYSYVHEFIKIKILSSFRIDNNQNFIRAMLNRSLNVPDLLNEIYFKNSSHTTRHQLPFYIPIHTIS